jgi:hypothetical protein
MGYSTHATASAEGPCRAGPISDRVVNPEALVVRPNRSTHWEILTLDPNQRHKKQERASGCQRAILPSALVLTLKKRYRTSFGMLLTVPRWDILTMRPHWFDDDVFKGW